MKEELPAAYFIGSKDASLRISLATSSYAGSIDLLLWQLLQKNKSCHHQVYNEK